METKRIKVVVAERQTATGKKFLTYKTFSKNGRATEVKFRQEVTNAPKESGYITLNVDDMNLNTSGEYPVLWVRGNVVTFEPLGTVTEEQKAKNAEQINDYFG